MGQLGHGSRHDELLPRPVQAFKSKGLKAQAVSTGAYHTCAVIGVSKRDAAQLFAWGDGQHGRLGLGDDRTRTTPQEVLPAQPSAFHSLPQPSAAFHSLPQPPARQSALHTALQQPLPNLPRHSPLDTPSSTAPFAQPPSDSLMARAVLGVCTCRCTTTG